MTAIVWIFFILVIILIIFLMIQFLLFIPGGNGFPVLMYHKVQDTKPDGLTVTPRQFEKHLKYLKRKGYRSYTFRDLGKLEKENNELPPRSVILTFDDAYENYEKLALPLLRKYDFRATLLVPVGYIGGVNEWDGGHDPILDQEALRKIAAEGTTEIGLHSLMHGNYGKMSPEDVLEDLGMCCKRLETLQIPFTKVLAYPYGAYPRKDPAKKEELFRVLAASGLLFALRIGNRLNKWPVRSRYEITRTDIRGTDSLFTFKTKVKKGRSKLFA
jgi:peptidoglycan/xylan/chitin deacetylase (PgdA/CDA1 family)